MTRLQKILLGAVVMVGVVATLAYSMRSSIIAWFFRPTISVVQEAKKPVQKESVVAQNLNVPWDMAVLPDGDYIVTERPGTLKRIGKNMQTYTIAGVQHTEEGGLLGLALHPNFVQNNYIFVYLSTTKNNKLINRVTRYTLHQNNLAEEKVIVDDLPAEQDHDGGGLAFGPDSNLYITVGDTINERLAQDTTSLAGKILRVHEDGSVPADNPFRNVVYSFGHRNPQGIAWDNKGQLWATEHGRSGKGTSGFDELNRIVKGGNYGWPIIQGDQEREGMIKPVVQSGANETWAPSGLAYWNGSLFFSGLRGQSLYEARVQPDGSVKLSAHFRSQYGRLRATVLGSDNKLYITTSNRDGRGKPQAGDDKLIRVDPRSFRP